MRFVLIFILALGWALPAQAFDVPTTFDSEVIKKLERGPVGMAEFTERITSITARSSACALRADGILEMLGWVTGGTPQPIEDNLSPILRHLGLMESCFRAWNEARALKDDIDFHQFDETLP